MMALVSSSPGGLDFPHHSRIFQGHHLAIPSSPTAAYQDDGEISPTFDASFASSMSITSDPVPEPSPISLPLTTTRCSPAGDAMDISPAPAPAYLRPPVALSRSSTSGSSRSASSISSSTSSNTSLDIPSTRNPFQRSSSQPGSLPAGTNAPEFPFLKHLFASKSATDLPIPPRSESPENYLAVEVGSSSKSDSRKWATLPPTHGDRFKPHFPTRRSFDDRLQYGEDALGSSDLEEEDGHEDDVDTEPEMRPPKALTSSASRQRAPIPAAWSQMRNTAPAGSLLLAPPALPTKRLSEPTVPTFQLESSPVRMDVDGRSSPISVRPLNHPRSVSDSRIPEREGEGLISPWSAGSGASDRVAELFIEELSPIPASRKRFLIDENSPTPASGATSSLSSMIMGSTAPRRAFDKAQSTTNLYNVARRRTSSSALNAGRRPSLAATVSMGPAFGSSHMETSSKRHAAQAHNGRPEALPKSVRRAYSVADASLPKGLAERDTNVPASMRLNGEQLDYFSLSASRRTGTCVSVDMGSAESSAKRSKGLRGVLGQPGSPVTSFRSQEEKGKALPCHSVREDGLMRITANTLKHLQEGQFASTVARYLIIDCRFSYEFDGGHIVGAINMPRTEDVENRLLGAKELPKPSTSEERPAEGKTVLIFHCEFSAKRAPTSAKHLRAKDRMMNAQVYPNVHYPEVYLLEGGYAAFHKSFPTLCTGGYLSMDDPEHNAKRSVDLHAFRQKARQFGRASSFTFGQAQSASAMLLAANPKDAVRPLATRKKSTSSLDPSGFVFPPLGKSPNGMSIHEEEHESADSSFGTNGSSPGGGDSPCPVSKVGRHSLKIGKEIGGRRGLDRAQTSSVLMFRR